ncbi:MAG TPA: 50S ribosomal protein L21 [Gammaproteobacteria bacterium]|nr:50S ribosomal protein L21 [Gammaproteobacteria bacterium]
MYAIIKTGGKQLKVAKDSEYIIEKVDVEAGKKFALTEILLVVDGETIKLKDKLAKSKVEAEVVEHFRGDKIVVRKFKRRKNYSRVQGHRQSLTRIRITEIA